MRIPKDLSAIFGLSTSNIAGIHIMIDTKVQVSLAPAGQPTVENISSDVSSTIIDSSFR
jgi:hypothetical protein